LLRMQGVAFLMEQAMEPHPPITILWRRRVSRLNMSITLTPEQDKIIPDLLATGKFNSSSEVIQAALHLFEQESYSYQVWVEETPTKVKEGMASLERGEGIDGETFVNKLLVDLQQVKSQQ
jgi:antitoxin ParD1/3/4